MTDEPEEPPVTPRRYLQSSGAAWEMLAAEAFHEPPQLEGWVGAPSPTPTIILFAGGPMRFERRRAGGRWEAATLRHGDLMLRPAGAAREVRWRALSPRPSRTLHLQLGQELVSRAAPLAGRFRIQDPLLAHLGFALWRELAQGSPSGRTYVEAAAGLLAAHLWRHHASPAPAPARAARPAPASTLTPRQLARVVDHVRAHLADDLALDDLARQARLSPFHFARLFRRTTGQSPHQFILGQRAERARRLLEEGDLPLVLVAAECGFASQSHLTRVFRERIGTTPGAYRAGARLCHEPQDPVIDPARGRLPSSAWH